MYTCCGIHTVIITSVWFIYNYVGEKYLILIKNGLFEHIKVNKVCKVFAAVCVGVKLVGADEFGL